MTKTLKNVKILFRVHQQVTLAMRLTSKGRYAVTAMLDVALHSQDGPVPLADISERQGISLSYLEQLFSRLRKNGLVASVRGPGGGYLLGKDASAIAVGCGYHCR